MPDWSSQALRACLARLSTSRLVSIPVHVEDAWTEGPEVFCVVYRYPRSVQLIGARFIQPRDFPASDPFNDPEFFGAHVADFSIGEPLGSLADTLREDSTGVMWWGPRPRQSKDECDS